MRRAAIEVAARVAPPNRRRHLGRALWPHLQQAALTRRPQCPTSPTSGLELLIFTARIRHHNTAGEGQVAVLPRRRHGAAPSCRLGHH
jgi:hypothetical protein